MYAQQIERCSISVKNSDGPQGQRLKLEEPTQITQKAIFCTKCRHPREAHVRSTKMQTSGTTSFLTLRAECGVKNCLCGSYVGLVWER